MFDNDTNEQNKALVRLLESADLVRMLEDLLSPASYSKLSGAVLSGVRVTLRNIREGILSSHDSLAGDLVRPGELVRQSRPIVERRSVVEMRDVSSAEGQGMQPHEKNDRASHDADEALEFAAKTANGSVPNAAIPVRRSDLRSSLQKIVERA